MNICSINGTPRTIHTITLNTALTGFILLIVQNDINKPKGNEITNVNTNSKHVSLNPSSKYKVTSAKLIFSSAQSHAFISYFKFFQYAPFFVRRSHTPLSPTSNFFNMRRFLFKVACALSLFFSFFIILFSVYWRTRRCAYFFDLIFIYWGSFILFLICIIGDYCVG